MSANFHTHCILAGTLQGKGMVAALKFVNTDAGTTVKTNGLAADGAPTVILA